MMHDDFLMYANDIFNGVPQNQHDSNRQPIKKRPHSIIVLPLTLCVYVHIFLRGKTNSKKHFSGKYARMH